MPPVLEKIGKRPLRDLTAGDVEAGAWIASLDRLPRAAITGLVHRVRSISVDS
jgi:hypothetical protein